MGHIHFLGSSEFFDDEHDQGWNHIHPEHPYTSLARSGTSETRSHYPAENMLNEGIPVSSHWNSSPRPNAYTASGHGMERPHYNPGASGPSHEHFVSSTGATFSAPHENYVTFASSSNCNSQTWSNPSYVDQSLENVRGAHKRKSPCASSIYEMGSSSQYCGERTSSDTYFPSELHLGKSITHDHDPHYMPRLMDPTYRSSNLSIRGEGSSRNVRSRPTLDLETNVGRNNMRRSPSLDSHSTHHHSVEHSCSGQFPGQTSHGNDLNCARLSPDPRLCPGRRRSSCERFQSPFDEAALHERFSSEGFMGVDRQPHYYGSRNMPDHHRDMRLDIDNMTYEELLALGERIGSVNTGLSDSSITSCLLATMYYPLYQTEDQRKCAICLEEYKEKEELGELKGCGHDYHGKCIKKWLSMKNSCPICKSPALPDASKHP